MLFQWVARWAERRRQASRRLFVYHDGEKTCRADPAEIWRKLLNHSEMDFTEMLPLAEQGKVPEREVVLRALSEIFEVLPFESQTGRGLTAWEILDLVRQFDEYLGQLKKNTSPSRMPWQLLVYGSSTSREAPEEPMSSSADSSSTRSESSGEDGTAPCEPSPTP